MPALQSQDQNSPHIPVMIEEVLEHLHIQDDGVYLDGTIGAGGHAVPILNRLSESGKLIGLDRDGDALEICKRIFGNIPRPYSLHQASYDTFPEVLALLNISKVNGILLDLGLSSMQLESPSRGFAFQSEGALDMRFNSRQGTTAAELIRQSTAQELADIFFKFGEERNSRKIANSIKNFRPMETVLDLKEALRRCTPPNHRNRTLARIFQALRIAVNQELVLLNTFLEAFINYLSEGGRIVIISYHSLEDRLVKHAFKNLKQRGFLEILTKKPLLPSDNEQAINRRSRSAKLRSAERIN